MKLATKKFFHNVLALVVSVCMVCTLTPSVAWATGSSDEFFEPEISDAGSNAGSGDVSDANSKFFGNEDGTATGETKVKARVYDVNFKFETLTPGKNYQSVNDFKTALGSHPFEATFNKGSLPEKATVTWYVQEVIENPAYKDDPTQPKTILTGTATPVSSFTYDNPSQVGIDSAGNPVFSYPGTGTTMQPNSLPIADGKMYEFSVVLEPEGSTEQASASTKVTFFSDYPELPLYGIGTTPSNAGDYKVVGDIYQAFAIPTPYAPDLAVAEVTSGTAFDALKDKANSEGEEFSSATSMQLDYGVNQLPDGKKPYLDGDEGNGLQVTIPVPDGFKAGDKVNIYEYNESTAPSAKLHKDVEVEVVKGEDGKEYLAAVIEVSGTGVNIGTFAVGAPMKGSYAAYVSATEGGSITPSGTNGTISSLPLGKSQDFTALAVGPGYAFAGFKVSKTGEPGTSGDYVTEGVSGNSLKFDPTKYSMADGNSVYIKAFFTKVGEGSGSYTVDAFLSSSDDAKGSMTIAPAVNYDGASSATINMNGSGRLEDVPAYAGLFLKFEPNAGCAIDYVQVNGEDLVFNYGNKQVMIGALTGNTTIQVGYKKQPAGAQTPEPGAETPLQAKFINTNKWPAGINRAILIKQDGSPEFNKLETVTYENARIGNSYTISLIHNGNYRLESATLISADGSSVDVTASVATTLDDEDSLELHNIASGMTVAFDYVPREADFTGTATGGTGSIWVEGGSGSNSNTGTKAKAARLAASAPRAGVTNDINVDTANKQLTEGNRARILAEPMPGYELGRVEINGTNVTDFFRVHGDGSWTMTVYRTETGIIPEGKGQWTLSGYEDTKWADIMKDPVIDQVVPIEGTIVSLTMTFNEKVPTMGSYQTITTKVEGIGGTITPSFKVEKNASAIVEFFPDDTYRVARIVVDGDETKALTFNDPSPATSLKYEFENVTSDHTVTVEFAPGSTSGPVPKSYTVTPVAAAGGSISPSQPVKVYEGDKFTFSLIPKTGYMLASDPELEGSGTLTRDGLTCTLSDIRSDCNLIAKFTSTDDEVSPTHVVRATCNAEGGTVKPSNPFVVANGADAHFTLLPKDGWYVKGVYVVDGKMVEANEDAGRGINLVGSVQDGRMFSLRDIQADTVIDVVFGNLENDFGDDPDEKKKHEPPTLDPNDGTFTLDPIASDIGEGATVSPNLADMVFVKVSDENGTHAAAGTDLTIIISSGYELDENEPNGGISIKHGENDVTTETIGGKNITVRPAGDGLYEVKIPAEFITPNMNIAVKTKKDDATQGVVNKASVEVSVSGNGTVYPVANEDSKVEVESGKSQTFSFIPDDGWKLHRVYVNDEAVTVTGNAYTIHNITGDTTRLQAVFVEGEPDQPVVTHNVNVVNNDKSNGTVTPEGLTKVADGAALSVLVAPGAGYRAVAYDGPGKNNEIRIAGNTIEIANIDGDRTINVYFESVSASDLISLVVTHNAGGTVSPVGNTLIAKGQTQTLSILPDAGKAVQSVTLSEGGRNAVPVNAISIGGGTGIIYTTPAAKEKMVVEVVFCNDSVPAPSGRPNLPTGNDLRDEEGNTTYHEVTAFVAAGGGTVVPTYAKVAHGATMTYTFVPLDGYHFDTAMWTPAGGKAVRVYPRSGTNNTTFVTDPVDKDADLRVTFAKDDTKSELEKYYTIFASAKSDGSMIKNTGVKAGGTISPAGPVTVAGGGSQSFTIMPDPNCKVQTITISNTSAGGAPTIVSGFTGSSYTLFGVSNDLDFTVTFTALKDGETAPPSFMTHSINASASLNGSISPAGTRTVDHGGDAMFTFVPWDGYKLSYIIVDGVNIPANLITNMQYTFAKVTENHTIHAVFIGESEKATDFARLDVHFNDNGTASPRGTVLVEKGQSKTIDVTPFLRYKVVDIAIDGKSITPATNSNFSYTNDRITDSGLPYSWVNGQLTLKSVTDDTDVGITFGVDESYLPGPGEEATAPGYEKVTTKIDPPSGGGTTSIQPDPVHLVKPPTNPSELEDPLQNKMDITITPEDGKIPEKIVVKYGDGTEDVYDRTTKPSVTDIYEKGYVTVDTDRGDVNVEVEFGDLTDKDKEDIKNGTLKPATYVEVNINYSAGGTVGPAGTIKVAKGSNLTLQMIPNANYEVASVTVDGSNKTGAVLKKTRTYIEKSIQTNKDIYVAFGFVKSDTPEKTYTLSTKVNSAEDSGSISPASTEVREKSSQIVYFLPAAGYKIGKVTVKRGTDEPEEYLGYNSPSMAIRNIASDVRVEVEYIPGENSWTLPTVPLRVEVGAGAGRVSPERAELPVGSSIDVNFYPDDEWTASYYTLNGQTYPLPQNVSSWPVTPDPEAQGDDANVMRVFFERYDIHAVDNIINVKLVDSGDGSYHGSASPYQATVPSGGSTTFYVIPEVVVGKGGYTIDYVRFNGVDQKPEGVINPGYSDYCSYSANNSNLSLGSPNPVKEADVDRLSGSNRTYYNAYSVTLDNVVTSGTLEIKFKKIPNGQGTMVMTSTPTMTVTSIGGGTVNPVGEVKIPAGETLDILTTSFESYYLYSVIKDENGVKTDLSADVVGRVAKATMGNSNCTVTVRFEQVKGNPDADVNVSLIKATYNGNEITKDVQIGAYVDPDTGKLVPLQLNEQGVVCGKDGEPISYVRGGSYEFYFSTSVRGENGRELVLKSATYAGKSQSIIPGANYLTNVVLNASGGFELEFRELNEGEQILNPSQGYYVFVDVVNEHGAQGSVTPPGPFTRTPGSSVEIALNSNSENVAVSSIVLQYVDGFGAPQTEEVPASEYADGTLKITDIDRDYTITVVFDVFSIVRVNWDNSLGFVTPNHEPGSCIYRPVGEPNLPFLVAPYQDNELVGVYVGESADAMAPLDPSDDEEFEKQLNKQLGLAGPEEEESGGITTMALGDDEPTMIVQPTSTEFAKVYGVTAPLAKGSNTYLTAEFKSTKVNENHTITSTVKNGHGTVEPLGAISVPYGASQTFTAKPENGYAVVGLVVDGNRVPAQPVYTFGNVIADHTIEFEFGLPQIANGNGGTGGGGADRLLRVASKLAQTGDLTGPVVGLFLIIAAAGLVVTGVSYMRRQQRRRQRMAARAARQG